MQGVFFVVVGILIGLLIGYLFAKIAFSASLKKHRQDAVSKSTSVVAGQVAEKIAPLLPNFPYNTKDLTFVGKGVDYIVFDGLFEGDLKKVVFLEIKTGKSTLNKNETMIKRCLESGNVFYEIIRL